MVKGLFAFHPGHAFGTNPAAAFQPVKVAAGRRTDRNRRSAVHCTVHADLEGPITPFAVGIGRASQVAEPPLSATASVWCFRPSALNRWDSKDRPHGRYKDECDGYRRSNRQLRGSRAVHRNE